MNNPGDETLVLYRCRACGAFHDARSEAVRCYERHTRMGEQVEHVVVQT